MKSAGCRAACPPDRCSRKQALQRFAGLRHQSLQSIALGVNGPSGALRQLSSRRCHEAMFHRLPTICCPPNNQWVALFRPPFSGLPFQASTSAAPPAAPPAWKRKPRAGKNAGFRAACPPDRCSRKQALQRFAGLRHQSLQSIALGVNGPSGALRPLSSMRCHEAMFHRLPTICCPPNNQWVALFRPPQNLSVPTIDAKASAFSTSIKVEWHLIGPILWGVNALARRADV